MVLKRPKTIVIEGRVDARSLATIAKALTDSGIVLRSKSFLVSSIIEAYCDILTLDGTITKVDSTALALELLSKVGIVFHATKRRNLTALSKQISSERALGMLSDEVSDVSNLSPSEDMLQRAMDKMEQGGE